MSDVEQKLELLKKELSEKDKNLMLSAKYGKDLLIQNAELHSKIEKITQEYDKQIENFEQEKYSLSLTLDAKERIIGSLTAEIESQEKNHKETSQKVSACLQDELFKLQKKLSAFDGTIEMVQKEISIEREKFDELQSLLDQYQQNQHELTHNVSENGLGLDDLTMQLEAQIATLSSEKQQLEKKLLETSSALKTATFSVKHKEAEIASMSSEIEEKECQLTAMFNSVERSKEEMTCLRMEIEQMKLAETDPKKKGNSLFGELEDHRQALEKNVISLNARSASLKKQNDLKAQQIAKLKLQIASLLNMATNGGDLHYQKDLQESLELAKSHMTAMTLKCRAMEEQLSEKEKARKFNSNLEVDNSSRTGSENILKYLYDESQTKIAALEKELSTTCFAKVSFNDQVLQLKRKLHLSEKERKCKEAELIRLTVKLEEVTNFNVDCQDQNVKSTYEKPVMFIERLPDTCRDKGALENRNCRLEPAKKPLTEVFITHDSKYRAEPVSKNVLDEKLDLVTPLPAGNKENVVPLLETNIDKIPKCQTKRVKFECEEETDENAKTEKKMTKTKHRRKMEAPVIKVTALADSKEECKVQ